MSDQDDKEEQAPKVPFNTSDESGALTSNQGQDGSLVPLQTQHPFYRLPPELMLDIVDYLPADSFINFAFANYPLLHRNGLAPPLSQPRVTYITRQTPLPAMFPLLRMPSEITLHIMRHLKPIDIMRFVVASYQILARQGIAPELTEETIRQLRNAIRARFLPGSLGQ